MAEEGKKISFGFAKSIKKPVLKNTVPQEEKKVDYIECLDEKAIKVIGGEEKKEEPLIIPLLGSKTWHDRIANRIDADIFESKTIKSDGETSDVNNEQKEKSELSNGNILPVDTVPLTEVKTEPLSSNENTSITLEEQAAREIIEDLSSVKKKEIKAEELTLPLPEDQSLRGKEESTLDDYEKIPVDAFGVAMLRGMGWQPGKGIGKNEKIVPAVTPELRPKGMGLGADKVMLQKQSQGAKKEEEELKIEKGTFVKIIAGKQSDNYGQIEGFDDDSGRLIVKMALGGNVISLNEFMVQPVTKSEYTKNAKVLNAKKYQEYKDKEKARKGNAPSLDDSSSAEDNDKNNVEVNSKKSSSSHKKKHSRSDESASRTRKKYSSDSNSDNSYERKRRKRSRSTSNDTYRSKKTKKSKKHKRHDSSPERSSKKHRKKDKEKEKARDRRSKDSDYTDRRKRKKYKRSRSRSSNRQ